MGDKRVVRQNRQESRVTRPFVAGQLQRDDKPPVAYCGLNFGWDHLRFSSPFSSRPRSISGQPRLEIPVVRNPSLRYIQFQIRNIATLVRRHQLHRSPGCAIPSRRIDLPAWAEASAALASVFVLRTELSAHLLLRISLLLLLGPFSLILLLFENFFSRKTNNLISNSFRGVEQVIHILKWWIARDDVCHDQKDGRSVLNS